jgi:hypothetical protein
MQRRFEDAHGGSVGNLRGRSKEARQLAADKPAAAVGEDGIDAGPLFPPGRSERRPPLVLDRRNHLRRGARPDSKLHFTYSIFRLKRR